MAFYFRNENAEVTDLDVKGDRLGLAFRVLPDFKATAALQIGSDAGMAALRLVSRLGKHQLRNGVIFQNADVHLEHLGIPFPRFHHILSTHAHLLYSYNIIIMHCTIF